MKRRRGIPAVHGFTNPVPKGAGLFVLILSTIVHQDGYEV
jgi:hypothetical protein